MFKFVWDQIFSPYTHSVDRFLMAVIAVLFLVLLGVLIVGMMSFIDSVGVTPTKTTTTVVEQKHVVPAHTTIAMMLVGKVMVPITTHHPESYYLDFKIDGKDMESSVDKNFFDKLTVGEKIEVDYGLGRLTGNCTSVNIRAAR